MIQLLHFQEQSAFTTDRQFRHTQAFVVRTIRATNTMFGTLPCYVILARKLTVSPTKNPQVHTLGT